MFALLLLHVLLLTGVASAIPNRPLVDNDLPSPSPPHLSLPLPPLPASHPAMATLSHASKPTHTSLHITSLTNRPDPPFTAHFQCWRLNATFSVYPTVGRSAPLGTVENVTYVVLPPRSAEGWHRPPHAMFFVLLSGAAEVYVPRVCDGGSSGCGDRDGKEFDAAETTIPSTARWQEPPTQPPRRGDPCWDSVTVTSGSLQQVLIAADTDRRAKGHLTFYPGDGETVALQIPFRDGGLDGLGYRVVHDGACRGDE